MLSNTKLSNLVLKTHLNFESFMMINYVKKNRRKNSIFFLHDGLFFKHYLIWSINLSWNIQLFRERWSDKKRKNAHYNHERY